MSVQKHITGSRSVEIEASIESAIRRGRLTPGTVLPTVRACAMSLGVSPATVASAYRTLRERGYIVTQGRRGTIVSPQRPQLPALAPAPPPGAHNLADGNPDPRLLPALGPALAHLDPPVRLYGSDLALAELLDLERAAFRADRIAAEHVSIVSGALDGLERVLREYLRPGDRVGIEDPAFSGVLALLQAQGLVPVPIQIDERGFVPEALEARLGKGLSALVLTPRSQNPMGSALDAERARELRRVLRRDPDLIVVEDDHAGAVAGAPAFTLCRGRAHWAVVRSHSKALGPDLRVAALAGDAETISRIEARQLIGMRWVSHVLQRLVHAIRSARSTQALLRRADATYTRRRRSLITALSKREITAYGRSGLNVWIPVPEESAVVAGLLARGWVVAAGERFRIESPPGIRVTTAALDPVDAEAFASDLAPLLRPEVRTWSS